MKYAVKNEPLGVYFAGVVPLDLGDGVVITPMVFGAAMIDTKKEAERVCKQMPGDGWGLAEITDMQTSPNLRRRA